MKPLTKTRLILGGLVVVHVVLHFYEDFGWPSYDDYCGAAVLLVIPTQAALLGFWIGMEAEQPSRGVRAS